MTFQENAEQYARLQAAIDGAKAILRQHEAHMDTFLRGVCGVKPGDIIRRRLGDATLKVARVTVSYVRPDRRGEAFTKPGVFAFKQKKDGGWHVREVSVWQDYEIVGFEEPAVAVP